MAQQRKILSDNVLMEIENMIVSGLRPGDKVPTEKELSEQFGVGRSTIRESMKALVAKGLIERTTEGTFVSNHVEKCLVDPLNLMVNMEIGKVRDLLELREIVELGAIRIAAEKIDDETIAQLKRINWQMQEPGAEPSVLQERDIQFHNAIAGVAGNKVLVEFLNAIRRVIADHIEDAQFAQQNIEGSSRWHQNIISALEAHDPQKAHAAMKDYFRFNEFKGAYAKGNKA